MLYQMHEFQRALLNPMTIWAEAGSKLYSNPFSPLAHLPMARRISAGFELMYRLGKEYEKPEFGITTVKCAIAKYLLLRKLLKPSHFAN